MYYGDVYNLYIREYIEDGRGNFIRERVKQQLVEYHYLLKQLARIIEDTYINEKENN